MPSEEQFFLRLENLLDNILSNALIKNAQSEQSTTWGWTDQKNFSHGWTIGFLQGICYTNFIQTYNREPDSEEEAKIIEIIRKQRYKIKEMIDREFELSVIRS